MNLSNGASFANGSAMDLGSEGTCCGTGESYGMADRNGTRPPASWLFKVLVFKL